MINIGPPRCQAQFCVDDESRACFSALTCSTLDQHCTNVIEMFCVCCDVTHGSALTRWITLLSVVDVVVIAMMSDKKVCLTLKCRYADTQKYNLALSMLCKTFCIYNQNINTNNILYVNIFTFSMAKSIVLI